MYKVLATADSDRVEEARPSSIKSPKKSQSKSYEMNKELGQFRKKPFLQKLQLKLVCIDSPMQIVNRYYLLSASVNQSGQVVVLY